MMLGGFQRQPYWWDDTGLQAVRRKVSADPVPEKLDTLVVGAGYSGLSAAITLARGGRDVTVIDADAVGFGCSSRNGGLIGPSFHKLGLAGMRHAFGEAKAHALLHEFKGTLDHLKGVISDEGIDCGLQVSGRFRGASKPHLYDAMARETERLAGVIGLNFEVVPRERQRDEIGTDFYHGGILYPDDGHLHPGQYLAGLAECALAAGARIFAPARLTGVQRDGDGFEVEIGGERSRVGQILIATNGYSGPALPYFRERVVPLRSAIIATEPMDPARIRDASPKGHCFTDSSRLVLYYRPSPDGTRMVFGGRAFDRADYPDRYAKDLKRLMDRVFPQLSGVGISHAWSGTVAFTFDHTPHLGCHDGLYYTMGYCGSGVGRSTFYGHKAALKMLGDPAGKTELDGLTFPTRPLYTGTPWFLPVILRWHSLADRFGY